MSEDFFQFFIHAKACGTIGDLTEERGRDLIASDISVHTIAPMALITYPSIKSKEAIRFEDVPNHLSKAPPRAVMVLCLKSDLDNVSNSLRLGASCKLPSLYTISLRDPTCTQEVKTHVDPKGVSRKRRNSSRFLQTTMDIGSGHAERP
jgi:hypothetical protein